jgi:hypothetical protein
MMCVECGVWSTELSGIQSRDTRLSVCGVHPCC